jgi:hypothetical protein
MERCRPVEPGIKKLQYRLRRFQAARAPWGTPRLRPSELARSAGWQASKASHALCIF